ncbi:UDP-N-acetylglucosamine 2-epimerase [Helicobacter pametensis]|uniref:UDP-N-acetylglucosamine 2-epimerase n=1 Tax=Helicobacter pametensis TaxID=95149 RepID=UPI000489ED00|nr:UDP-N-acetylglucosamine 2-epimerase [Helicobacter pametensis]
MKKIIFLSGTRADWGKIKPLIQKIKESKNLQYKIFACGMHLLELYGSTYMEIYKDGFDQVFLAKPYQAQERMDLALSECIAQFSAFIQDERPDMIVVHGDRLEALAGAIVGAFNNILVAHIEGGEVSGTIDESIRHSISKLAHLHFVANQKASSRLVQLGEKQDHIFVIGSPDLDVMNSSALPSLTEVCEHYHQIKAFDGEYAIFAYHPTTTEHKDLPSKLTQIFQALKESNQNFIIIYPNNDLGSDLIIKQIQTLENNARFAIFKSIKFESFLTLLKNAQFILGNSSAGVREAPFFGIPCINLGSRQNGRYEENPSILSCTENKNEILKAINTIPTLKSVRKEEFGDGKSAERFIQILRDSQVWDLPLQKNFVDVL